MPIDLNKPWWPSALLAYSVVGPLLGASLLTTIIVAEHSWLSKLGPELVVAGAAVGSVAVAWALLPSVFLAALLGFYSGGSALGLGLAVAAIGLAAYLGIGTGRLLSAESVRTMLARRPAWQAWFDRVQQEQGKPLLATIFLARLSPHMPFAATNLLLAQLKFPSLLLGVVSWLGLIPRTLVAAAAGGGLASFADWRSMRPELPIEPLITGALALALALIAWRTWRSFSRRQTPRTVEKPS